jgi:serine O-acetyltransferase
MFDFNRTYEKAILKNLKRYKKGKFHKLISIILGNVLRVIFNCDICLGADIGNNVKIPHAVGIVIGSTAIIEDGVIIMPNVVIGASHFPPEIKGKRHATIKRNCLIGANAVIIGNVTISENVTIAAGAVVTKDIPPNSIVVGNNNILKKDY